ncbi:hypothetical protein BS47DRAFT_1394691 [Hydnum rufescens UP504]|uniref:Uncharacterized protein n=1 Tax=Hydnum rufescens UP504 TaxID=1448309 RepID=A0A9P6AUM7_9AGAM|nr:hypothetical protein BS47DRAFT_1394691 [Hydnum rufescens UP504]
MLCECAMDVRVELAIESGVGLASGRFDSLDEVVLVGNVSSSSTTAVKPPVDSSSIASSALNTKSLITKDDVFSSADISYAEDVLPEACCEMFERSVYLPLAFDQSAKCSDNKRSEDKTIRRPAIDRSMVVEFNISNLESQEVYANPLRFFDPSDTLAGYCADMVRGMPSSLNVFPLNQTLPLLEAGHSNINRSSSQTAPLNGRFGRLSDASSHFVKLPRSDRFHESSPDPSSRCFIWGESAMLHQSATASSPTVSKPLVIKPISRQPVTRSDNFSLCLPWNCPPGPCTRVGPASQSASDYRCSLCLSPLS